MNEEHENKDEAGYGNFLFEKIDPENKNHPSCSACGDPVRVVYHSGGIPMYAQHCHECYAEIRYGKIPPAPRRRKAL